MARDGERMAAERPLADRYQLEQLVGGGGMGAVWRGRDLRLDRPVAIKMLTADALRDPTALERFDREARTVARLTHPNIVTVYDFGTDGAQSYLVMEFVDGWSVAALLTDGPLPISQAVAIAAQTCDGLTAAHAAGVIHRDVKPGNLIVTPAGVVKICDFGIARLQGGAGQARLTGTTIAVGSTKYMAPEQVNNAPIDGRTDIYGLGCTLYAMLAGGPPFVGDSPLNVVHQHLTQPPPPVQTRRPDVPAALATLVEEMLAKDPQDRPADATQVKARLSAFFEEIAAAEAPTADLRLAALPAPAAVEGMAAPGVKVPMVASSPPPLGHGRTGNPGVRGPRRKWRIAALGCAVLLAALSVPLLSAAGCLPMTANTPPPSAADATSLAPVVPSSNPTTGPATPPSPTAETTASERPTPVPKPTAIPAPAAVTPPPSPSPRPTDPIVGMRLSIQRQVTAGHLTPEAASELYKKVDEIADQLSKGDTDEASKKIEELREKLVDLHEHGKLSKAGYDALNQDLDRLDRTVP